MFFHSVIEEVCDICMQLEKKFESELQPVDVFFEVQVLNSFPFLEQVIEKRSTRQSPVSDSHTPTVKLVSKEVTSDIMSIDSTDSPHQRG